MAASDVHISSNSTSITGKNRTNCCIDALVISKGASSSSSSARGKNGGAATCVFGYADQGRLYGVQITDYIVGKLLVSERYESVIAICLDRPAASVRQAAAAYLQSFVHGNSDSSRNGTSTRTSNNSVEQCMTKLYLWSPPIGTSDEDRIIPELLLFVRNHLDAVRQPSRPGDTVGVVAVVLFSLSELLLSNGPNALRVVDGIRQCADVTVSVFAVVHSTLHPPHLLSRMLPQQQHGRDAWSPFNTAVFVRPNDGTISDELACEVHVVRVSSASGKVVEDRDYFLRRSRAAAVRGDAAGVLAQGPQYVLLAPVAKMKPESESVDPSTTGVPAAATVTTSTSFNAQQAGSTSQPNGISSVSASLVATATANATNRRLITFDSTDPEFDDDSDPDADLDL